MLVVVGGHSSGIGNKSIVTELIRAMPRANWTAVKITQHRRKPSQQPPCVLTEQKDAGSMDGGQYLAAGARKAFCLMVTPGHLEQAVAAISEIIATSENTIVESNSILEFVHPDLYLAVLDFAVKEFNESCRRFLARADAYLLVNTDAPAQTWRAEVHPLLLGKPQFCLASADRIPKKLVSFLESLLWPQRKARGQAKAM
jgi:hypothetical protein